MAASKWTFSHPSTFILISIPGLEEAHVWIPIPFCSIYVLSLLRYSLLLAIIKTEPALHEPMFLFLAMLASVDLVVSTAVMPKALSVFWFRDRTIHINARLAQIYLLHSLSVMESAFMPAMAFDRYIAICNPLRHSAILTNRVVAKIGLGVVMRGAVVVGPHPILLSQLPYCRTHIVSHTYCEFMALVNLACVDMTIMSTFSLLVAFLMAGIDLMLIVLSYFLILWAIFKLPSKEAHLTSLGTCGSHIGVILGFYSPALFSIITHRFGHSLAPHVHIIVANVYVLVPLMMNPLIYGVRTKKIRKRLLFLMLLQHICDLNDPSETWEKFTTRTH
ncbi:olfactory receptor 52K2-like [Carettochelys insculpta]|uniref:olfactory receptor 52K2-like n=1 Tax=Carettochelys insculpta TaxID=44489 RepID=UPI003EB6DC11